MDDPTAPAKHTVLLLGGTGRTGGRVLRRLLGRGVRVRAVVRSAERLPASAAADPNLAVVEADLSSLSHEALLREVEGCDVVISCLGHVIDLRGILGPPRDLVAGAIERVCLTVDGLRPARPVKVILMTSVSVNRSGRPDTRRGRFERAVLWVIRGLLPPARDNQRAADVLQGIGTDDPFVQWVVVRPDTLKEGDVTAYALHDGLVDTLFRPGETNMANIADFMAELVTDPETWARWQGRLPVIVNAPRA